MASLMFDTAQDPEACGCSTSLNPASEPDLLEDTVIVREIITVAGVGLSFFVPSAQGRSLVPAECGVFPKFSYSVSFSSKLGLSGTCSTWSL